MIALIDLKPWIAARERPSPNFSSRKPRQNILGVVLHHTGGSDEGAESWMEKSRGNRAVSCHLHFRRDGSTTRMVDDHSRAWHAGSGEWRGSNDVNGITLGWEIGNAGNGIEQYTDLQYAELSQCAKHYIEQGLTLDDFTSHDFTADGVIGSGRKNDPLGFDWDRFYRETQARIKGVPVAPPIPYRVWSKWFGEYLIVVRYNSDTEWFFLRESEIPSARVGKAATPLSQMPKNP